jgi:hypothetical protein
LAKVQEMMPRVVKKWRKLEDGSGALEEYWDMIFADDEREANPTNFKSVFLALLSSFPPLSPSVRSDRRI